MKKFNELEFIKKLVSFSPRQLAGEKKTADYICAVLDKHGIVYRRQYFNNFMPASQARLLADSQEIPCEGTSFVSGKIVGKKTIVNVLKQPYNSTKANINFNPLCPEISPGLFFWQPAVAVASKYLPKLFKAETVMAEVKVNKIKHQSSNILVGNLQNPKNIFFCHYDCHHAGAVDNASGTAVVMSVIVNNRLLKDNLYVIAGAEELSFDQQPAYWGFGYRFFEKKYFKALQQAQNIYVVDSLGFMDPVITNKQSIVYEAFPLKNIELFRKKISIITMDLKPLMSFYHSDLDKPELIKIKYLQRALKVVAGLAK